MGAGATTDRWPQLVIDPTLNRIIADPKQPRLQNPPGLPEKGGVVSVSDGRREEGWRWMWKRASGVTAQGPIDLLIISHPSLLLSGLQLLPLPEPRCRLVEDKFCWAPLYWIYELMEMSRHNRLGSKEENRRWRRLLFALPLSLMWRAFETSRSKLHRISEAMLSVFSVSVSLLQKLWNFNGV